MPTTSRKNIAATGDALAGLKFKTFNRPTLVTVAATGAAAANRFSYSVGSEKELCTEAEVNIEAAADVVDISRDLILSREPAPPGEHFLTLVALGTAFNFLRIVEVL